MAGKSGRGFAGKSGFGMGTSTKGIFGKASSHVNKTGKTGRGGQQTEHHGGAWVCLTMGNAKSDATPQPLMRHAAVDTTTDHPREKETVIAPKASPDAGVGRAEPIAKERGLSTVYYILLFFLVVFVLRSVESKFYHGCDFHANLVC